MCHVPPLLSADISDEKVVMFLDSRNVDDPIPSNVIADVDPFTIDPRLSSGRNNWYIYKSIVLDIHDQRSMNNGYWEFLNDISISTSTPTIGRKITRKFYLGTETSGDKTTFRMHEYYIEHDEKNKFKETSLSRIFSETDEVKNEEESDTCGENTKSKLPCLANQQERYSSYKQPENEFQVSIDNEVQSELPNELMYEELGFEEFIELKDLFDREDANSSFSGNTSSVKSMTSDEHSEIMGFDPEGMINDIANDVNNMNGSVSSGPVIIQPPLSLDTPVSPVVQQSKSEVSTSDSSESSDGSTSAKHSGNGSSCKRTKSRSAKRMAKLGKRYCCFI